MDDLISRQAAIEVCKGIYNNKLLSADGNIGAQMCADKIFCLPSVQPEQRWIPCSVRLPEDDTEVLVYLFENNKSPYIAWLSDGRWYTEYFEVEREDEPVAWMPLPEPYQGGEQE